MTTTQQQIIISGVGGQGVLFVTRLLAEAAIRAGLPVLTSETHGMAQRGGTVISHLKVGSYASPLIRPGRADGMLALKAEAADQFSGFVAPGGWVVSNGRPSAEAGAFRVHAVDADATADHLGNHRAVNLILLGYAFAADTRLFCDLADIKAVLSARFDTRTDILGASLDALEAGYRS